MIWYDDLFVGESISPRRKKRIIRKVNRRSLLGGEYLLTLASNLDNLIDIINARVIRQRYYPKKEMVVVGLAGDYEEAMLLAGEIISGIYAVSGDFKVRDFFEKSQHSTGEDGQSC